MTPPRLSESPPESKRGASKRTAYKIVIRCTLTGADWHLVRWLTDPADAHQVAKRSLKHDPHFHANHSRLVDVRPATEAEVTAHRARIAAI